MVQFDTKIVFILYIIILGTGKILKKLSIYFQTPERFLRSVCTLTVMQGRRQRGIQWCPAPPFEIGAPPFHVWPTSCYIHPLLYF